MAHRQESREVVDELARRKRRGKRSRCAVICLSGRGLVGDEQDGRVIQGRSKLLAKTRAVSFERRGGNDDERRSDDAGAAHSGAECVSLHDDISTLRSSR